MAINLTNLAGLLYASKRLAEAAPLLCEALRIDQAAFGKDHPAVAKALNNLASVLQNSDRNAEAEPLSRRCLWILAKLQRQTGRSNPDFGVAGVNYTSILLNLGVPESEIPERLRIAIEEEPPDMPENWGEGGAG